MRLRSCWGLLTASPEIVLIYIVGRIAEGISLLKQAVSGTETLGFLTIQSLHLVHLGEAYVLGDQLEDAHAIAGRALTFARERCQRNYEAFALRLLGDISVRRESPEHAEGHYP